MTEAVATAIERLESMLGGTRDPLGRGFAPIAELLRTDGRLDEARVRVEEGTRQDPSFASGHMVAARIYADLGDDDRAAEALEKVLSLDPANEEAGALRSALEVADEEEAIHWAKSQGDAPVVEVTEGDVLTVTMGDLYLSQGAPDRAVSLFERMLAEDPENAVLRDRVAEARRALAGNRGGSLADIDPEKVGLAHQESEPVRVEDLAPADPVSIESLAPVEDLADVGTAVERGAPVAVQDLGPEVTPVQALAPDVVGVQDLAPDSEPVEEESEDGDVDNFMAWLDDQ